VYYPQTAQILTSLFLLSEPVLLFLGYGFLETCLPLHYLGWMGSEVPFEKVSEFPESYVQSQTEVLEALLVLLWVCYPLMKYYCLDYLSDLENRQKLLVDQLKIF
jgi:hypothetical protein